MYDNNQETNVFLWLLVVKFYIKMVYLGFMEVIIIKMNTIYFLVTPTPSPITTTTTSDLIYQYVLSSSLFKPDWSVALFVF